MSHLTVNFFQASGGNGCSSTAALFAVRWAASMNQPVALWSPWASDRNALAAHLGHSQTMADTSFSPHAITESVILYVEQPPDTMPRVFDFGREVPTGPGFNVAVARTSYCSLRLALHASYGPTTVHGLVVGDLEETLRVHEAREVLSMHPFAGSVTWSSVLHRALDAGVCGYRMPQTTANEFDHIIDQVLYLNTRRTAAVN